jgi:hypothetical protein
LGYGKTGEWEIQEGGSVVVAVSGLFTFGTLGAVILTTVVLTIMVVLRFR